MLHTGDVLFAWKGQATPIATSAAAAGFKVVDLNGPHLYLDHPSGANNLSWADLTGFWLDLGRNYTTKSRHNFLGGEVSMWMNNYCSFWECHMTYATKRAPRMCAWYGILSDVQV